MSSKGIQRAPVEMNASGQDEDAVARARLRERLGTGARYDSPNAPHRELSWARRGTAYFARKLNELSDEDLDGDALVSGWNRRHVVAHVGYQARKLSRLVEAARTGAVEERRPESEPLNEDVDFGSTLPAHALRYLFAHSEVHLNVEWRDLPDTGWNAAIKDLSGQVIQVRDTPWLRAREIWEMAVALGNGGRYADFPPGLLEALKSCGRRF